MIMIIKKYLLLSYKLITRQFVKLFSFQISNNYVKIIFKI